MINEIIIKYILTQFYGHRWVVLDEVDRLLDMGFEQTILEVLSTIRGERLPGLKEKEVFLEITFVVEMEEMNKKL